MHHALGVRRLERLAHLRDDRRGLLRREPPFLPQQAAQVLAFDKVHADELDPLRFSQIENADHVLVRHLARQDQLLLEAPQHLLLIGQLRTDHLERHDAIQLAVARLVDRSHAALAQQLEDFVAPAQHAPGHERLSEAVRARRGGGLRPAFRHTARHRRARARDGRAGTGGRHAGKVERRVTLRAPDGPGRVLVLTLGALHRHHSIDVLGQLAVSSKHYGFGLAKSRPTRDGTALRWHSAAVGPQPKKILRVVRTFQALTRSARKTSANSALRFF